MFDLECQMRFWKSATDAAFGYASATLAAATIMQENARGTDRHESPAPTSFDAFNPFALPFQWWATPPPAPSLMMAWNPFDVASANTFFDPARFFSNPFLNNPWPTQWTEMMRSFGWPVPQPSWTMWQYPMTAALMAGGMPFSVASPAARANASAMDAADAARDGFNKAFASYQTGGGHAASHAVPMSDLMSIMMAPWSVFAEPPRPGA